MQADGESHERQSRRSLTCSTSWAACRSTKATAGDIVAIVGLEDVEIGDTISDVAGPPRMPRVTRR